MSIQSRNEGSRIAKFVFIQSSNQIGSVNIVVKNVRGLFFGLGIALRQVLIDAIHDNVKLSAAELARLRQPLFSYGPKELRSSRMKIRS